MLKSRRYDWAPWIFLLLIACDFAVALVRTCPPSEQQKTGECAEKYYGFFNTFSYLVLGWIEGHHNFVIAAATVAIASFTLILRNSTERLWISGERHSERQLRAYIGLDFGVGVIEPAQNIVTIILRFKNSGQTPAYAVRSWHRAERELSGRNDLFDSQGTFTPEAIISPSGTVTLDQVITLPRPTDLSRLISKDDCIYVRGRLEYTDAFGESRWFDFKATMNGLARQSINVDGTLSEGWGLTPIPGGFQAN